MQGLPQPPHRGHMQKTQGRQLPVPAGIGAGQELTWYSMRGMACASWSSTTSIMVVPLSSVISHSWLVLLNFCGRVARVSLSECLKRVKGCSPDVAAAWMVPSCPAYTLHAGSQGAWTCGLQ